MFSCSSENSVLSSFSKRKYLKNFKETKKSYEVVTEEETAQLEEIKTQEIVSETVSLNTPIVEENNVELTPETVNLSSVVASKKVTKQIEKEYRNWDKFNRTYQNELLVSKEQYNHFEKSANSLKVNEIVLAILAIFIPPLAVYLHEDAITANFWVDLLLTFLFWLPGIIFAFLVIFAGVSL
ncbi:MAG: YqaE/Pmp3 family membrane protein [Flavobacteriales bacterium]|nr:YqaE/Pmp3 family membrane protein [Flavobacteriales bacterium]